MKKNLFLLITVNN